MHFFLKSCFRIVKKIALFSVVFYAAVPSTAASPNRANIETAIAIHDPTADTNINTSIEDSLKVLSPKLEAWAINEFAGLNQSIFFDTNFIVNSALVRERHLKYRHDKINRGQRFSAKTSDGFTISGTYFNRNSDKLLIIGEGFTNDREKMTPFLSTFNDYDIILFDFRGQGYNPTKIITPQFFATALASYFFHNEYVKNGLVKDRSWSYIVPPLLLASVVSPILGATLTSYTVIDKCLENGRNKNLLLSGLAALFVATFGLNPCNWSGRLSQMTFGVNSRHLTLGDKEEKDVIAVVKEARTKKEYKQIYGLGICYGAFVFAKTQAMYPGTFNKLILDGCWHDLPSVISKLRKDLKMLSDPQRGGWSNVWPFSRPWCQNGVEICAKNFWGLCFDGKTSLGTHLLNLVDTPILFFQGKDDLLVSLDEFSDIWNKTASTQKTAIVTSNEHVINHLKQKQLYKVISELFFDLDYPLFVQKMKDVDGNMDFIKKHFEIKRHGKA